MCCRTYENVSGADEIVVPCIYDMLNKKELRNIREEDLKILDI